MVLATWRTPPLPSLVFHIATSSTPCVQVANQIRHIVDAHRKVRLVVGGWVGGGGQLQATACCLQGCTARASHGHRLCLPASLPHAQPIPSVLEIPSKDCPYDPAQDGLLTRVRHIFGAS